MTVNTYTHTHTDRQLSITYILSARLAELKTFNSKFTAKEINKL